MAGSDFPVEGDKLKKLVKKSRSMPISFGFNPGTSDDDDEYLAAHPRKQPEVLGKLALTEGAGTKSAFGTFAVDGSEVHLTCLRSIPQLAKKFKKYLKRSKITLNVVVMDPDGTVIDSDVEVLDDWFQEVEDIDDMVEDAAEAVAEAAEAAMADPGAAAPAAPVDPSTLAARLKAMQPKLAGVPPAIAEKLMAAFRGAVDLLKAGQTAQAGGTIAQIEAVLNRLAEAPPPAPPAPPAAAAAGAADPRLPRLREAVEKRSAQVAALLGGGAGPLLDDLARIDAQIDAGEAEAALTGLRGVQEGLKTAQAAREKWDKAFAMLEGQVNQALSARSVASPDDLRTKWQFAVALAGEGGWDRAVASLPAIVAILRAGPGDGPATDAPPKDGVAFQTSRILWVGTRQKMFDEARKLADAIVAQSADDADAAEIAAAARQIVAEVEAVDTRLQDVLDRITVTPEGRTREQLKRAAAGVVAEYRALLATGIFPALDQNPFAPVAVTSRARAALDQIARTLA